MSLPGSATGCGEAGGSRVRIGCSAVALRPDARVVAVEQLAGTLVRQRHQHFGARCGHQQQFLDFHALTEETSVERDQMQRFAGVERDPPEARVGRVHQPQAQQGFPGAEHGPQLAVNQKPLAFLAKNPVRRRVRRDLAVFDAEVFQHQYVILGLRQFAVAIDFALHDHRHGQTGEQLLRGVAVDVGMNPVHPGFLRRDLQFVLEAGAGRSHDPDIVGAAGR